MIETFSQPYSLTQHAGQLPKGKLWQSGINGAVTVKLNKCGINGAVTNDLTMQLHRGKLQRYKTCGQLKA